MAETVWMRHPNLPPEQLIEVPKVSLPHHQAAGWEVAEAPTKPKPLPRTAEAATVPDAPALQAAAGGEIAGEDADPEGPAPDAGAATPPKRPRKTATKAEES